MLGRDMWKDTGACKPSAARPSGGRQGRCSARPRVAGCHVAIEAPDRCGSYYDTVDLMLPGGQIVAGEAAGAVPRRLLCCPL